MNAPTDTTAKVRASGSLLGPVEALDSPLHEAMAKVEAATCPMREAMAKVEAATRPMREAMARVEAATNRSHGAMPQGTASASVLAIESIGDKAARAWFRRWQAMTPRQRARALLVGVRRRVGRRSGAASRALAAAIGRTTANLAVLVGAAPSAPTDANPPPGRAFALVLLDSTRPVHGPPALPA